MALMDDRADMLLLIMLLKKIVFNFEEEKNEVDTLFSGDENYKFCQGGNVPNDSYYREFESYAVVIDHPGGQIGDHLFYSRICGSDQN